MYPIDRYTDLRCTWYLIDFFRSKSAFAGISKHFVNSTLEACVNDVKFNAYAQLIPTESCASWKLYFTDKHKFYVWNSYVGFSKTIEKRLKI